MVLLYELCQTFYDSTLTHTRLTYKDRIVFLATSKNLNDTLYLPVTTSAWVQLTIGSSLSQICAKAVEYGCLRVALLLCSLCARTNTAFLLLSTSTSLLEFFLFLVWQSYTIAYIGVLW